MKFKKGDKVRCIEGLCKGVTGTVSKITDGDCIYCDDWSDGVDGYFQKESLELLSEGQLINNGMKFRIGDGIRIRNKPETWSSLLGKYPLGLDYPRISLISSIKEDGAYIAMGTKDGYGFSLTSLIAKNNIELLTKQPSSEQIRGKVNKMKAFLLRKLSPSKRVQYKAGLRQDDLTLTEEGKEVLLNMLADRKENDTELTEVAKDMLSEK